MAPTARNCHTQQQCSGETCSEVLPAGLERWKGLIHRAACVALTSGWVLGSAEGQEEEEEEGQSTSLQDKGQLAELGTVVLPG